MAIGIICEYNPFHNGHLYHLQKIKEKYQEEEIILVLSGNFLQRGNLSLIDKYDKTEIALAYGVNLVVELPFPFATQSSDIFAKGAISLLQKLKCDKLIFGSESNNIELLTELAKVELEEKQFDSLVKKYLKEGLNYPTALSIALKDLTKKTITAPNDLLGLSYIKEIIKRNCDILPLSIQRTNDYHSQELNNQISSASAIRKGLTEQKNIKPYLPDLAYQRLQKENWEETYFLLLKYKILSEKENIKNYQTVEKELEHRILKVIQECNSLEELIQKIKTKRHTYNKIHRMLTHILCSFTKEEAQNQEISYIQILGLDKKGKNYLNQIKKKVDVPIISKITKENYPLLQKNLERDAIYHLIMKNKSKRQKFLIVKNS